MKARFIDRLVSAPWHIGSSRGRAIIGSMLQRLLRDERPGESISGRPLPRMEIVGDVAVIPIGGTLMLNVPDWIKDWGFGLTDVNDIEGELTEALSNSAVSLIMFDYDSPGGESVAGQKLFEIVEAAAKKKPVGAWTGDGAQCCSAAYNGAAAAAAVYAGRFAEIGSVGTYMVYLDDSKYWADLGMKWETFRSGEFKGIDGELSEAQRAHFQAITDEYGSLFRANVRKYRTAIDPADLEGQTFRGVEAAQRGFIAATARDRAAAVGKLRGLAD